MPVPTITGVSPSVMFTGGHLLTITGTNFRTAYPPPLESTGVLPVPPPTVSVTIGTRAAKKVTVFSATELTALVGPAEPGALTITVQNLDSTGAPISGETASSTSLLTAARVDLAVESDYTRLERTLMRELKRQVIANVLKTVAVDYDGTVGGTFEVPDIAELPALAIQGPQVVDNRFYDLDLGHQQTTGDNFTRRATFKTIDLTYRFVGMDTHAVRNMNLMTLMLNFIQNNPFLEMPRVYNDLTKGYVKYELAQVGEFTTFTGSSSSDIRGFSGSIVIRGFQVEDVAGFVEQMVAERGRTVDNVSVQTQGFSSSG